MKIRDLLGRAKDKLAQHIKTADEFSLDVTLPRPRNLVRLQGSWRVTIVTLQLPIENVLFMLPQTGRYELHPPNDRRVPTQKGMHRVVFYFGQMFGAGLNLPFFPGVNYREQVVGVPDVLVKSYDGWKGPFFYMPQLLLDHKAYTLGGWVVWGFNKRLATFRTSETSHQGSWEIGSIRTEEPLISVDWTVKDPTYQEAAQVDAFYDQRRIMKMSVISQPPVGAGQLWVRSDFKKTWKAEKDGEKAAIVRNVSARLRIGDRYCGGAPPGIYDEVNGVEAFQFITDWSLTFPRPVAWD